MWQQHPCSRGRNYGVRQRVASRLLHWPPPQLQNPCPPCLLTQRSHSSRAHAYAHVHTNPHASHTTFSPGEWCTLAPPPPHLAPSLCTTGAFAEDPDKAGGEKTAEGG